MEPPHSTNLAVSLRWRWEETVRGRAPGAPGSAEAAFAASLRAALASPPAARLREARLELSVEPAATGPATGVTWRGAAPLRRWPLAEALRALPASVTGLSLDAPPGLLVREGEVLEEARRILQDAFPGLLELQICGPLSSVLLLDKQGQPVPCVHRGLQRLQAGTGLSPRRVAAQLPALTRLEHMRLSPDQAVAPLELQRLAARGLRVRSLSLSRFNLASPGAAAALAAIFRPAEFDWALPGPSTLRLDAVPMPDGGLPPGFGAGVQQVHLSDVPHAVLPWLSEAAKGGTLRSLSTVIVRSGFPARFPAPVELLEALRGCHDGLEVLVRWPAAVTVARWDVEGLEDALRFLRANRSMLVAVRICLGEFLAAVRRTEGGGAAGPRTIAATLLAAEYSVTRCEVAAERRRLLGWEVAEVARLRERLEAACRAESKRGAALLSDRARPLLERCRSLPRGPPATRG